MAITYYWSLDGDSACERFEFDSSDITEEGAGCIIRIGESGDFQFMNCWPEQEWWDAFSFVMRDRAALEDGK